MTTQIVIAVGYRKSRSAPEPVLSKAKLGEGCGGTVICKTDDCPEGGVGTSQEGVSGTFERER